MKNWNLSLFFQYLLSYIVVLFIPLLVLGGLFLWQFVDIVREEAELNNQGMLTQMKDIVDVNISEMNRIAAQISTEPELTPYFISKSFYNALLAKRTINFTIANEFIDHLIYYIRDGPYLYSSQSTYTISRFINDIYQYKEWSVDDFHEDINTITHPVLRPAEDVVISSSYSERYITYIVPVPVNHFHPYGTIIFQIKESALREMLHAIMKDRGGNAVIVDEQGRIVTSLVEEPYLYKSEFVELSRTIRDTGTRNVSLNDTSYIVSHVESESSGWTYMTFIPEDVLLKTVNEVQRKALTSLLIIILLGGFVIYYVMHLNYNPLEQLIRSVENKWGRVLHTISGIDTVKHALNHMEGMSRELIEKVKSSQPVMRQQFLMNLLKGQFLNEEEYCRKGEELGIHFLHASYFVIIIHMDRTEAEQTARTVDHVKEWLQCMNETMDSYHVDVIDEAKMTWICSMDRDDYSPKAQFEGLRESLLQGSESSFTLGIGNIYDDLNQVGKSYMEAVAALDYRFIKGKNQIICIKDVASEQTSILWYPSPQLEQLTMLIKQGDIAKIKDTVYSITSKIKEQSETLFMARCLSYDLMNTMMKAMAGLNQDKRKQWPNVLSIMDIHTADEMAEEITRLCVDACEQLREPANHDALHISMINYIAQNYDNQQITIQQIADYFGISSSYASRYFKEQTNQTIWEYVNQVRIEQAMVLLKTTTYPLQEIVSLIGYNDVSSFIRKFKQAVKLTPGEYRKLFEGQKEDE